VSAQTTGRDADPWAHGTRRHSAPFWDTREIARQFPLTTEGGTWSPMSCATRTALAATSGPLELLANHTIPGVAEFTQWGYSHNGALQAGPVLADLVADPEMGGRCWHARWLWIPTLNGGRPVEQTC
jgi:hypothetical protein